MVKGLSEYYNTSKQFEEMTIDEILLAISIITNELSKYPNITEHDQRRFTALSVVSELLSIEESKKHTL